MTKKSHGIRCVECGCRLDPGERCDCEKLIVEKRTAKQQAKTRQIIANNMRAIEQAMREWDCA